MNGSPNRTNAPDRTNDHGELWVWQDCLVRGPADGGAGACVVLRCGTKRLPAWTDPELAGSDYRAGTEKALREVGLEVARWIGQAQIVRPAAGSCGRVLRTAVLLYATRNTDFKPRGFHDT